MPAMMTVFAARFGIMAQPLAAGPARVSAAESETLTVKDEELDAAIAAVATGDYEHVRALYERPLAIVGECSRPTICAASGHVLIGGDFSAIESRVLAWVAGEEWKLDSLSPFR